LKYLAQFDWLVLRAYTPYYKTQCKISYQSDAWYGIQFTGGFTKRPTSY